MSFTRLIRAAACCIPYAFLCLWGDAVHGTLLLYAFSILCAGTLFLRTRTICLALFASHGASFFSSLICLYLFQTERWNWYFKPLSAPALLIVLSLSALAIHLLLCRRHG